MNESNEARDSEREALDALLSSPGWRIVRAYIERNWGPKAYRFRCQQQIGKVALSADMDITTQHTIAQVEAVTSAMELLEMWPAHRLKQLMVEKAKPARRRPPSRGAVPNE